MGILTSRNGDRGSGALVKKGVFTGILPEVHNLREDIDTLGELSSADSLVYSEQLVVRQPMTSNQAQVFLGRPATKPKSSWADQQPITSYQ